MAQERYGTDEAEVDIERVRLGMLAAARDPKTFAVLEPLVVTGMRVLEVGAGAGTVSSWLADRVGPQGSVVSTDIDLQFHDEMPDNVEVRRHDIENEPIGDRPFDLIHARAVLQHVPSRETVISTMVDALAPGGWLVLEDSQFLGFAEQGLAEPYRSIHQIISAGSQEEWRDPNFGLQILDRLRAHGLVELDVIGDLWAMRPGEPGGEWWFLALERAIPHLVAAGLVSQEDGDGALAQVRAPGFVMLSPASIATVGRAPA